MNKFSDNTREKARRLLPEALAQICEDFYPQIYRYIAYRVNRKEDVEDLTSEVFLRAVRSIRSLKGSLQSWLYRIAENLVTDHYRRRAVRKSTLEVTNTLDTIADSRADVYQNLSQLDLQKGLKRLTGEQYQVIILKFIEGYSTTEIASILDKSTGAVKALQFRALQNLRSFFSENEQDG